MVDGKKHHGDDDAGRWQGHKKIHLSTEGEQEQEALDALVALINNYFDEGE